MIFKALKKGDIMREDDYVADEEGIHIANKGNDIGLPWNKTAYYPRYRKVGNDSKTLPTFNQLWEKFNAVPHFEPVCKGFYELVKKELEG